MVTKAPIALILGAGANIGDATARLFSSKGYKVALAARSLNAADSTDDQLKIPADFSKTADIVAAFSKVKEKFGIPSVVVYNGWAPSLLPMLS
jgi:NAD(P)-dependent dehydrogenase (short-subunit alcohol dehydrogenase family)